MLRIPCIIASLIILILSLTACASSSTSTIECNGDFEATVHQGKNAGLSLAGKLSLRINPAGSLVGALATDDSTSVAITGYAISQSINLVFDLGGGRQIFGVGSLQNDIRECKGLAGGPFTGPEPGDSGDWGYAIGGRN
jgi:hypothetical protein